MNVVNKLKFVLQRVETLWEKKKMLILSQGHYMLGFNPLPDDKF